MIPVFDTARRLEHSFPNVKRWIVALSGGLESHVLLHVLVTYARHRDTTAPTLLALHVNHGRHTDADRWQVHCAHICHDLDVAFQSERAKTEIGSGTSIEEATRKARYDVFESHASPGDLLLQGHHRDDQAETVLLRLLGGSGPADLSGIPDRQPLGGAHLARPLLQFTRAELLEYAQQNELHWIEDPGNDGPDQDREFLRHEILPLLGQRWPDVKNKLFRTAEICRETAALNENLTRQDIQQRSARDRFAQDYLDVAELHAMEQPRLRNLFRQWLRNVAQFTPSSAQLTRLQAELLGSHLEDTTPRLQFAQVDLGCFRQRLYLVPRYQHIDANRRFAVSGPGVVDLGPAGRLHLRNARGQGLRKVGEIEIRLNSGPESCQLDGMKSSHSLKRQLQDLSVPPWLHSRLPLVYVDGQLAALADLAVCAGQAATTDQEGLLLEWEFPGMASST